MTDKRRDRIADRPRPEMWSMDEILTLSEAARLCWPDGFPISERTLRTAARDGRLAISIVAGKYFVTRRALSSLSECVPLAPPDTTDAPVSIHPASSSMDHAYAAIDRMQRKRSVSS